MAERVLLGGRYELGPAIGSGGFATVFRARDRASASAADVAVKLVPPGFDAARLGDQLGAEAAVLTRLRSPHLARIHDFGRDEQGVWLVTELVDGVALSTEALGRALFPHEVLRVARGLLEGLGVAHAAGIVHADVKPANILVPRTEAALDQPKLIDFGIARPGAGPPSGVVVGSARWLAPEVLAGREADFRSDVYAAGLVLFALLGVGELFPDVDRRAQLEARRTTDPVLAGRVVEPLASLLQRMLAREPARRFLDANEALATIVDLDTAPVSLPPSGGPAPVSLPPSGGPASVSRPPSGGPASAHAPLHPSSVPAASRLARRDSVAPRLLALADDPTTALGETLLHLDLPMLDALARRERGHAVGRVARAAALALRLELDAAALVLEPLLATSDVARAVGASLLGPQARRATRARVDVDHEDAWVDTVPVELAALLAALATSLSGRAGAARDRARCTRALARLEATDGALDEEPEHARRVASLRVTLLFANAAADVRSGAPAEAALDRVAALEAETRARLPFERTVRPLLAAAVAARLDEGRARDELERATRAAAEHGATLLEAGASAAWGHLLVEAPHRAAHALVVLERLSALLGHGDVPGLAHEAEHHRGAALVVRGRWRDAIPALRAAREAAHAEQALEAEVVSASLEIVAHLALGDREPAHDAAAVLGAARIDEARGRAGALAWVARSIEALASGESDAAEDALAEASARADASDDDQADALVLVEVLGLLFDAARGALRDVATPVAELERLASERGFTSSYWLDGLQRVVERIDDPAVRGPMLDVLGRVTVALGPARRIARDRRTSAPPGMP